MASTHRRYSPRRGMAWRADTRDQAHARLPTVELISLLALLVPVVAGTILVGALRRQSGWSSPLLPALGVLICLGAVAIHWTDGRRRERPRPAMRIAHTVRPGILAPVAIALSLLAALYTIEDQQPALAAGVWVLGLAMLLGHALALERPALHPPTPIDAGALLGLLALALLLRLPHLADLPNFVHSDEAQMGLHTRLALEGGMPTLFGATDWWSVPWLGPAIEAPLALIFGDGLVALRLASVVAGVLATAGIWFLGRELWSYRAGFVAALLFAVLAPSVHFSRDGVHYMQSIAALVWTVLCYTRATKRYSAAYAALTGILVGVDVQLYYAARLAVPLVFGHAAVRAAMERGLLHNWLRIILWTALGLLTAFLPMAAYYATHLDALAQRTDAVAIFAANPAVRAALLHEYGTPFWPAVLGEQAQRVSLGFLAMGDRSEQYGASAPLLDPVTAALIPAACAVALARLRHSGWLLCAIWLLITLTLGGLLTTQQPDAPRLLAAIPAICLLVGGLAHALLHTARHSGLRDATPLLALALAGLLIVAAVENTDAYLDAYPRQTATAPVTLVTDVARYLSRQPGTTPVVLFDHREFYLAHWTIQLLAPQIRGVTVWDGRGLESALATIHGPFLLLAVDPDPSALRAILNEYAGGTTKIVPVHDPRRHVLAYRYTGAGLS